MYQNDDQPAPRPPETTDSADADSHEALFGPCGALSHAERVERQKRFFEWAARKGLSTSIE